jgi:hypothetical protein
MDATDNPGVEAHEDVDTLDDGTGASADEGSEEIEETPSLTDNPLAYIETMEGVPEEVKQELRRGFLRQADYTKKTQVVSDDRRRLEEQRSVVDQILLSQKEANTKEPEAAVADTPPDMANGASPEDVIDFYVNRAVQERLKSLGIGDAVEEIRPIAAQQRVVKAYQAWAQDYPDIDHGRFATVVGQVLDSDPDLTELAQEDPSRAIRIAAKVALANTSAAKTEAKSKKRRAAAPVASQKGTVVSKRKRETALEAATRALKEQGINI